MINKLLHGNLGYGVPQPLDTFYFAQRLRRTLGASGREFLCFYKETNNQDLNISKFNHEGWHGKSD
jgi:hypothetical protein